MLPLAFEVVATPDLFPGHSVSFTDVGFDDVGIRIEYTIAPSVPMRVPGIGWVGYGRDDLGNDYEDVGGAYGHARDGDRTNGVLTMPFPVDEARTLRVRLRPGSVGARFDDEGSPAYEVVVSLEL
ncbi:MAG: hypothetical protein ACXVFM_04470 [Solirubrobacteraceae bacterium]